MAFALSSSRVVAAKAAPKAKAARRSAPAMAAPKAGKQLGMAAAALALALNAAPAHAERMLPAIDTATLDKGEMKRMLTIYEARDLELPQNGACARRGGCTRRLSARGGVCLCVCG